MTWPSWLLLADALMAGVILAVQLVVYPGFKYFSKEALGKWHPVYTRNITLLVAPLMIAQLIGGILWATGQPGKYSMLYAIGIFALWAITFRFFVPLHRRIENGNAHRDTLDVLVRLNWLRTVLWFLVLIVHLFGVYDPA
jgi:hypothetical protein